MVTYEVKYTDTFGGQPNYSWVKRHKFFAADNMSERDVMCIAKRLVGLTGVRGSKVKIGNYIEFHPYRTCTVMFVWPVY